MKTILSTRLTLALAACMMLPQMAAAQVVISEIMYDQETGSDSGREWVEVFNAGSSAVHLTDWKFFEANTNHAITQAQGSESLASGAYAIIADDTTKFLADNPGYSGQVFKSTFSLSNTGETLAIHMPPPDLTESDSVTYQSAWGASGDGKTLQRVSVASAAFSPASPTPGSGNLIASESTSGGVDTSTDTASTSESAAQAAATKSVSSVSSYVAPPAPQLFVDAGGDRTAIVAADATFDARAYNREKTVLDSSNVRFMWNFGDGSTAEGVSVSHHYEYPGRYAVVVSIAQDRYAASDTFVVTAEPVRLAFGIVPDGGVTIENKAGRDLDLSFWGIKQFGRVFTLPEHSLLLAGSTLRISHATLGYVSGPSAELDYPNGALALQVGELASADTAKGGSGETAVAVSPPPVPVAPPASPIVALPSTRTAKKSARAPVHATVAVDTEESSSSAGVAFAGDSSAVDVAVSNPQAAAVGLAAGGFGWWAGAFSLAVVGAGAAAMARGRRKGEWDIVEEMSD